MKSTLSVLLVEDDPNVRLGCEQAMQLAGITVDAVGSAEEAQRRLRAGYPGIVVTDMRLPGIDGMTLLRWVVELDADLPVIMITGHGDVTLAVEAMRSGAYDFMQKPFSTSDLVDVVRRALEKRQLVLEVEALRRRLDHRDDLEARLKAACVEWGVANGVVIMPWIFTQTRNAETVTVIPPQEHLPASASAQPEPKGGET